tara:strand:- start:1415 stop:2317 length:903 start_codon:yes stop_codon:yes gene_type:complete
VRSFIQYLYKVFPTWIQIFATIVGFTASFIFFLPSIKIEGDLSKLSILILCLVLSTIIVLVIKPINQTIENLPLDQILFNDSYSAKILFPYQEKYLKPLNKIANSYYGKSSASSKYIKSWYEKNPYSLVTLADKNRNIIGYYDMLPLSDEFAHEFISGKKGEKDIRDTHILPVEEMKNANFIYFAGVAIKDHHTQQSKIFSGYLLYTAFLYLKKFYDLNQDKTILAVSATESGKKLLMHLDFDLEDNAINRKDKLDLYSKKFNLQNLESNLEKIIFFGAKIDLSDFSNCEEISSITPKSA